MAVSIETAIIWALFNLPALKLYQKKILKKKNN